MKMLITITISWNLPAKTDNSAIPSANAPADSVPNARLKPLFNVAPEKAHNISWGTEVMGENQNLNFSEHINKLAGRINRGKSKSKLLKQTQGGFHDPNV